MPEIRIIKEIELPECLGVIRKSFATVAAEFNLTEQNCPKHTSFMPIEKLKAQMDSGFIMFGLYDDGRPVGYASLSDEDDGIYELHNLSVLPECRHKGYGRLLIDHAKDRVRDQKGKVIRIGIIEENSVLKNWYTVNGFIHTGTCKFDHLPFTAGYMEWRIY